MYLFWKRSGKIYNWNVFKLTIKWVMKLVDYLVSGVGAEVMLQKHTADYDYFCTCNYFSYQLHFRYLDLVDWKEILLFCTTCHKKCEFQIYAEGVAELLYWIHQNNTPFVYYETNLNIFEKEVIVHSKNQWVIILGIYYKEKKAYVLLCIDVLGLNWIMDLVFSSQASKHNSTSLHLPSTIKKKGFLSISSV